jgi:hypothetical protein
MFSIKASSIDGARSTGWTTSAGIVGMPAIPEARQRLSPAISSNPPPCLGWTMIGWRTPRSRIESTSALSDLS